MWKKIKLILKSVRQYKKFALITPLFMIGEAFMECALPFVMSTLVDTIDQNVASFTGFNSIFETVTYTNETFGASMSVSVFGVIMTLILIALLSLLFGILGGQTAAIASVGVGANLRSDLFKKLQTFSFANIDKFSTSSLVTRLTTDVNNVQQAFQMCIRIVFRAPLMMIFSAVMAFISGGAMAWIFVFLVPIVGIGITVVMHKAMKIFTRVFKRYDKLNESVQENISGIRVVKAYVREEYEKEKFNRASNGMLDDFVSAEKIVALSTPIMNTSIHFSNVLVIGIGSYAIYMTSQNSNFWLSLTVGQMSSLITYGISILTSIMMISMIMVMLIMSLESVKRIGEVLEEEPTIKNPENPLMDVPNGDVTFSNVNFRYKENAEKDTLSHININIKSGQFIGILGSTGSGKTSVVNLISRLYDVQEGSVLVAGHNVQEYDLKTLRDNVAVVLQKNVLFSGTIASNLRWGNEHATEEEMWEALRIAQAEEIVKAKKDGLNNKVEQGGANYSGGQKQRLCIARALLKKPKILILDDSTSAVDTKTDRLIRKGLKEDLKDMTKIVIAQRISSIEEADQIIIMEDGHIDAIGTHEELIKNNKIYQEVYYTQNRVGGDDNATSQN